MQQAARHRDRGNFRGHFRSRHKNPGVIMRAIGGLGNKPLVSRIFQRSRRLRSHQEVLDFATRQLKVTLSAAAGFPDFLVEPALLSGLLFIEERYRVSKHE